MNPLRHFGAHTFKRLARIRPETGPDGAIVEYSPHMRFDNPGRLPLHAHGKGPFCRFKVVQLPASAGAYAITSAGTLKYIGECLDLAERFGPRGYGLISPRNCFRGGQSTNCRINHLVLAEARQGALLELWFKQSPSRKSLEGQLVDQLKPPWNI